MLLRMMISYLARHWRMQSTCAVLLWDLSIPYQCPLPYCR
uniref:Uncharacterized protein n=1 Tax=Arundo donax TaxID=35708 RepID=A0A0A9B027_ARUDO